MPGIGGSCPEVVVQGFPLAFGACRFSRRFGGVGRGSGVGRVFFGYSFVAVVLVVRCFFTRRVAGKD